ncbi:MAG: hypothetical protein HY985_10025 [Magnetospirillum sp.]|nr:hypothetical protein [Magnetospirillum sp.]
MASLKEPPMANPAGVWGIVFAIAAVMAALGLKLAVVGLPLLDRMLPPEVDDTYAYILTAVQFKHCLVEACPAIDTLLAQTSAGSDLGRWDIWHRLWLFHSPLWAVAMALLNTVGVSWEASFDTMELLTVVVVMTGIAALCRQLVGPTAAAVALVVMALLRFPDHGLYWFVPGVAAFGVACWYGAYALSRNGGRPSILLAAALVAISLHSIGRIYAGYMIALFCIAQGTSPFRPVAVWRTLRPQLPILLAIAAAGLAGSLVPALRFAPPPIPIDTLELAEALRTSAQAAGQMLDAMVRRDRAVSWEASWVFAALACYGVIALDAQRRRRLLHLGAVAMVLAASGIAYVHPTHPATLFGRLLPLATLFVAAALGFGTIRLLSWCGSTALGLLRRPSGLLSPSKAVGLVLAGAAIFYLQFSGRGFVAVGLRKHDFWQQVKTSRHDARFERRQWDLIAADCTRLGLDGRNVAFVVLSYGAYACPATFLRFGSEMTAGNDLSHAFLTLPNWANRGQFLVTPEAPLTLRFAGVPSASVAVQVGPAAVGRTLSFEAEDGRALAKVDVTAAGWIPVPAVAPLQALVVRPLGAKPVEVSGFRLDPAQQTNWPWLRGLEAQGRVERHDVASAIYRFDDVLAPLARRYDITILDDHGSSAVVALNPRTKPGD